MLTESRRGVGHAQPRGALGEGSAWEVRREYQRWVTQPKNSNFVPVPTSWLLQAQKGMKSDAPPQTQAGTEPEHSGPDKAGWNGDHVPNLGCVATTGSSPWPPHRNVGRARSKLVLCLPQFPHL